MIRITDLEALALFEIARAPGSVASLDKLRRGPAWTNARDRLVRKGACVRRLVPRTNAVGTCTAYVVTTSGWAAYRRRVKEVGGTIQAVID